MMGASISKEAKATRGSSHNTNRNSNINPAVSATKRADGYDAWRKASRPLLDGGQGKQYETTKIFTILEK